MDKHEAHQFLVLLAKISMSLERLADAAEREQEPLEDEDEPVNDLSGRRIR